jgi:hypothetical protein
VLLAAPGSNNAYKIFAFGDECRRHKTEMICKAFDDAWAHLKNADDTLADPSKASVIRTVLARRIFEMAVGDGMNSGKLRDDAIVHVKNNPLFP